MTEAQSISGRVENGRIGEAQFGFYDGSVGIRDRGDHWEVAFFSPPVRTTVPTERILDGQRVQIVALETRDPDPATPVRRRSADPRVIIATVIPLT